MKAMILMFAGLHGAGVGPVDSTGQPPQEAVPCPARPLPLYNAKPASEWEWFALRYRYCHLEPTARLISETQGWPFSALLAPSGVRLGTGYNMGRGLTTNLDL